MLLMIFWNLLIVLFFSSGLLSLCAKETQKRPAKRPIDSTKQTKTNREQDLKKSSASTDDNIDPQKKKATTMVGGTPNTKTTRGTKDDDGEYEENANVESAIEVKQVGGQIIYIKNGEIVKVV